MVGVHSFDVSLIFLTCLAQVWAGPVLDGELGGRNGEVLVRNNLNRRQLTVVEAGGATGVLTLTVPAASCPPVAAAVTVTVTETAPCPAIATVTMVMMMTPPSVAAPSVITMPVGANVFTTFDTAFAPGLSQLPNTDMTTGATTNPDSAAVSSSPGGTSASVAAAISDPAPQVGASTTLDSPSTSDPAAVTTAPASPPVPPASSVAPAAATAATSVISPVSTSTTSTSASNVVSPGSFFSTSPSSSSATISAAAASESVQVSTALGTSATSVNGPLLTDTLSMSNAATLGIAKKWVVVPTDSP